MKIKGPGTMRTKRLFLPVWIGWMTAALLASDRNETKRYWVFFRDKDSLDGIFPFAPVRFFFLHQL